MKLRVAAVLAIALSACTATGPSEETDPDEAAAVVVEPFEGEPIAIGAPGGALRFEIGQLGGGEIGHRLVADDGDGVDTVVVDTSVLGVDTSVGPMLDSLELVDAGSPMPWSDTFDLPTGKERSSSIDGVTQRIRFAHPTTPLDLVVEVVVTPHGAAFRTVLEGDSEQPVAVRYERASFVFSASSTVWMQPHDRITDFAPAYERIHGPGSQFDDVGRSVQGWNFPVLLSDSLEASGAAQRWTLLTEAGLRSGWAGSHIAAASTGGELFLTLPDEREGSGLGESSPTGALPLASPWRVVISSTNIGDVVESNLVRHLSPPDDGRDWSWVEPGRVAWSWWSEPSSPRDPDRLIEFVDLASELDWEYSLIDANWNEMDDDEFERVLEHAETNDVGVFLWYNSGGPNNSVTEAPRDLMFDPGARRSEMARIASLGVRGIKVDFFQSDKPVVIGLYLDILRDAADAELLVNFHGSTLPRGWSRTWPNLMTMESVAGNEQYLFRPSYVVEAPAQNVVLAFTRNVVGPMDFTPGAVADTMSRRTTDVHELSLAVVFESALTHFVDTPENYRALSPQLIDFLEDVPTVWDDIEFIDGHPDSHVAIARRHNDAWWIGAINGSGAEVAVDLSAVADLDGVAGNVQVLCDDLPVADMAVDQLGVVTLVPFGGCIIRTA